MSKIDWIAPCDNYEITLGFGVPYSAAERKLTGISRHLGIDFINTQEANCPLKAVVSGTVIHCIDNWQSLPDSTKESLTGGNMVWIQTDTPEAYTFRQLHLNSVSVKQGQRVTQGQVIGTMGATGAATGVHCHIALNTNGMSGWASPIDPTPYFLNQEEMNLFTYIRDEDKDNFVKVMKRIRPDWGADPIKTYQDGGWAEIADVLFKELGKMDVFDSVVNGKTGMAEWIVYYHLVENPDGNIFDQAQSEPFWKNQVSIATANAQATYNKLAEDNVALNNQIKSQNEVIKSLQDKQTEIETNWGKPEPKPQPTDAQVLVEVQKPIPWYVKLIQVFTDGMNTRFKTQPTPTKAEDKTAIAIGGLKQQEQS